MIDVDERPAVTGAPPLSLRRELARKGIHLLSAIFPIALALGVELRVVMAALATLVVVALATEWGRARHERVRVAFHSTVGGLLRPHEHQMLSGATWLFIALLAAVALLPHDVAITAMWAVSTGDAMAAVVGSWFGRRRVGREGKTLEGSLACALVTLAGAILIAHLTVTESVAAALLAAAAERPRRPLDDNVRIVIVVGGGMLLWRLIFT